MPLKSLIDATVAVARLPGCGRLSPGKGLILPAGPVPAVLHGNLAPPAPAHGPSRSRRKPVVLSSGLSRSDADEWETSGDLARPGAVSKRFCAAAHQLGRVT